MRDRGRILFGLAIFLVLATFPFWNRLRASGEVTRPELEYPDPSRGTACVEDTPYMTASHMDLLNRWRDDFVRKGVQEYTSSSGETYLMSLTRGCLDCHESRDAFCDRCHTYANVNPTCWDCHVDPVGR